MTTGPRPRKFDTWTCFSISLHPAGAFPFTVLDPSIVNGVPRRCSTWRPGPPHDACRLQFETAVTRLDPARRLETPSKWVLSSTTVRRIPPADSNRMNRPGQSHGGDQGRSTAENAGLVRSGGSSLRIGRQTGSPETLASGDPIGWLEPRRTFVSIAPPLRFREPSRALRWRYQRSVSFRTIPRSRHDGRCAKLVPSGI
jgi:hypothetical protein